VPGRKSQARINKVYGLGHARKVVRAAIADYVAHFVRESEPPSTSGAGM
jgi:hypothetical protein